MKIIEKYTGKKTYMFPNGAIATPEAILAEFPAALEFAHIVETDEAGEVLFSMENLSAVRSFCGLDPALSEAEAIEAIQELRNAEPEQEASPEERIAAALEFQNLISL